MPDDPKLVESEPLRNGPALPEGYFTPEPSPTDISAAKVLTFPRQNGTEIGHIGRPIGPSDPTPVKISANRKRFHKKEEAYREKLSNAFLESIGGLPEIQAALAMSESAKVQEFLSDLILKPNLTFTYLAHKHGISQAQMADLWRKYNHSKGLLNMMGGAPEIANHVVEDARSSMVCCPRCDGLKYIEGLRPDAESDPTLEPCPNCSATGLVRKPGDPNARRLMFQSIGYIGKEGSGGTVVNVNVPSVETTITELANLDAIDAEFTES